MDKLEFKRFRLNNLLYGYFIYKEYKDGEFDIREEVDSFFSIR